MTSISFCRLMAYFAFMATAPVFAASPTNGDRSAAPPSALDSDDMTRLVAVRGQVLSTHPELKAEEEKLKSMHEMAQSQKPAPTAEQKNAAFAEWKAYQKKMRAEMLKLDSSLAPIFAKLDESHKQGSPAPFTPAPSK